MSVLLPFLLLVTGIADAPAEQPAPARVVEGKPLVIEGKPLTVTVIDRTEAGDDADAPKAIRINVVGGEALVTAGDASAAPARKLPFIGVVTAPLSPAVRAQTDLGEDVGLSVESVAPESPAAKAGLEPFDILAKYDDQILCAAVQLSALVKRTGTGNTAKLTVIRRGKEMPIEVTVGEHLAAATLALERVVAQVGQPDPASPAIVVGQPVDDAMLARIRGLADQSNAETARLVQQVDQATADTNRLLEKLGVARKGPAGPVPVPPPAPRAVVPPGSAQPNQRFILVNPRTTSQTQSTSVFSDDQGQVIHREIDGVRTITILDAEGKQQYAGPWGGPEDLEKVPEDLRARVEKLQAIPEPPAPPAVPR